MKRFAILLIVLPLSACASRGVSPEFQAYLDKQEKIADKYYSTVASAPRAKMSMPAPNGGVYIFEVNDKIEVYKIEQQAPSPWARVVEKGITGATIIGGIYAGTDLAKALIGGAAATTYNTGGGDVSLSNVGNKNIAVGNGGNSISGHENPTEVILMEPEE